MLDSFCDRHERIVRWQYLGARERGRGLCLKRSLFHFVRVVWDISAQIGSSGIADLMEWKPFFIWAVRKKGRHEYSLNQAGVKINYDKVPFFALFPIQPLIWSRILFYHIKSKWLTLKLDQLRWYLAKVGARKWSISDIWWASYVGRIKFSGWHQLGDGGWLGVLLLLAKIAASSVTRVKCNSAYCGAGH